MIKIATLIVAGMLFFTPNINAAEQLSTEKKIARDEQVINRLVTMGQYLRTLKEFAVHADISDEIVQDNGQKLQFGGTADYIVRTPDLIRLDLNYVTRHRIYTYDGKALIQYSPQLGYYTTMAVSGTIGDMIMKIKEKYDLEMPLADLFLWGTDRADTGNIIEAAFIGLEQVDGHESEHFAFRQDGVDWQIWIKPGDQALPEKLVITSTVEPSQPSYVANLQWDLAVKTKDADFSFTPPAGAMEIGIVTFDSAIENKK